MAAAASPTTAQSAPANGDDLYVLIPRIRFDTGAPEERPDALSDRERRAIGPALLINELGTAEWVLGRGDDSSSYATGVIRPVTGSPTETPPCAEPAR